MRTIFPASIILFITATLVASVATAGPVGVNGAVVETYFDFPDTEDAALVSFDWDESGSVHYSVGDPQWGTKLEVYKEADPEALLVFESDDVWAGSQVRLIDDAIYFNDGGDFTRSASNYYWYDSDDPDVVTTALEHPYDVNLSGLAVRNPGEFFAAGTEEDWGPASLYYGTLDASGLIETPLIKIADIGESPGPMAFDPAGNLYYVHGWAASGEALIYRWDAAAVAAALADPENDALTTTGHEWGILPAPYDGATGMITDAAGNLYITATSWLAPSQLLTYQANTATVVAAAEYEGRLESLRYREHAVYVSCATGIFELALPQVVTAIGTTEVNVETGETAMFAVDIIGGMGDIEYQWYRIVNAEPAEPVGDNLPTHAVAVTLSDTGTQYFCVVTDDSGATESPLFTLNVHPPLPAANTVFLLFLAALLLAAGGIKLCRRETI